MSFPDPVLDVHDLSVSLSGRTIVHGVSFAVEAGCWFGLLGANGSGKTTMLRALNGRLTIDGGSVRLNGDELARDERGRAARIGFAPHPDSLPSELTGSELLDLLGQARSAEPRQPTAIYEALEVAGVERRRISQMSAGMRQRIAVFSAFIGAPEVVLLDEPLNWLDPVAAYDLKSALAAQAGQGAALVTALHDIGAFAGRCDRGLLLHEGRVVRAFDAEQMDRGRRDLLGFEQTVYDAFKSHTQPGLPSAASDAI
jgi:ABC-type multidrug transport system ATPase subunit